MRTPRWLRDGRAGAVLLRVALFAVLWWILTEGDRSMWRYAAVLVPVSAALSVLLAPPRPRRRPAVRRVVAAVALLGWFLGKSFRGGVDVAVRSLRRPVDLDPGLLEYRTSLPAGWGRNLLAGLTTLMPGTLSVDLSDDLLQVHVLDTAMPATEQLRELEARITRVLGTASE